MAIEASKREPIRVEAAENGVPADRAPVAKHLRASASHRLATTSAWRLRVIWKVTVHDCRWTACQWRRDLQSRRDQLVAVTARPDGPLQRHLTSLLRPKVSAAGGSANLI